MTDGVTLFPDLRGKEKENPLLSPPSMPYNRPRLRISLLAAALALPLYTLPGAVFAQAATTVDLSAGPLGRSLTLFASQRSIALSFDPRLTTGRQAPALNGTVSDRDGLQRLLEGSGLRLTHRADGSFGLEPVPAAATSAIPLSPLRISAQRLFPYSEGRVMEQDEIEASIKGNGDLGTLLRINPAVQFSDTARTARNMGEIRPADISINGAPYYQNLFLLDGVSINNDLDPASGAQVLSNVNGTADVASQSQGIAVDTDLIERLTVYDSNVPAAYGAFTGGVVEANSRNARDALHGKVWMRMARSAWDQMIRSEGQQETFDQSTTFVYQPRYDKTKLGARLEGRTARGIGLIGTIAQTRSEIPLRGYSAGSISATDSNTKTQTRRNTSASLAMDWRSEAGLELAANFTYAPTDDRYFLQNGKDSWFDIRSGGPVLSLRANKDVGAWSLRNTLSYSDVESSRSSDVAYFRNWARSEAYDWGVNNSSIEGSWGNVEQNDRKLAYKVIADRETFDIGRSTHDVQLGLSYQQRKARYERINDQYNYQSPAAATSCVLSNGRTDRESCSLSPVFASTSGGLVAGQGQYFQRLMQYTAGRFAVQGDQWSAWLQDDMRLGDVSLRPGIRLDQDSIWSTTTVSPRLAVSWDVMGRQATVISGGINRYHGRNFFNYLLREGRERLLVTRVRSASSTDWSDVAGSVGTSTNRISDVDIPHTDEWTLGVDQRWAGIQFNLKYVDRRSNNEVRRERVRSEDTTGTYASNVYQYGNNGSSRSGVWTVSVAPQQALRLGRSSTRLQLSADHTEVERNYTDYDDAWTLAEATERVLYKGQVMSLYDLPATDFTRPWSVRLSAQTGLPLGPGELTLSNFLRYRSGFRDLGLTGSDVVDGMLVDVYEDVDYPDSFIWDASLGYALALPHEQELYVRVEASNVLNRRTLIVGTTAGSTFFEPGRSYWLEMGYRF